MYTVMERSESFSSSKGSEKKARVLFFLGWTAAVAVGGFFIARWVNGEPDEDGKNPSDTQGDGGGGKGGDQGGNNGNITPPETPLLTQEPEEEGLDVAIFWQIIIGLQYLSFILLVLVKDKNPVLVAAVLLVYVILCDIQIFAIPNSVTDFTVSGVVILVSIVFFINRLVLTNLEKTTFVVGMLSIFILSVAVRANGFQKYLDAEPDLNVLPFISFFAFGFVAFETFWQRYRIGRFKLDESYTSWLEDKLDPEVEYLKKKAEELIEAVKPYEEANREDLTQQDVEDANELDAKALEYNQQRSDVISRIRKLERRAQRREVLAKALVLLGEVTTLPEINRSKNRDRRKVVPTPEDINGKP